MNYLVLYGISKSRKNLQHELLFSNTLPWINLKCTFNSDLSHFFLIGILTFQIFQLPHPIHLTEQPTRNDDLHNLLKPEL